MSSILLLTFIVFHSLVPTKAVTVGVNYVGGADLSLPPPDQVAGVLQSLHVGAVRIHLTGSLEDDSTILQAFRGKGIPLMLVIESHIAATLSNRDNALLWVKENVVPYADDCHISAISVGVNVRGSDYLPAVRNVYSALVATGVGNIDVSTEFSFDEIITNETLPSAGRFDDAALSAVKPVLQFLKETGSSFFINLYPYNSARTTITSPGFATFVHGGKDDYHDDGTVRYRNVFDIMVDTVFCAMASLGYGDIPIVVTQTGWPSKGNNATVDYLANWDNAESYVSGLVSHLLYEYHNERGFHLQAVYIYELFDEETALEDSIINTGKQWGIMNPDMSLMFDIDFLKIESSHAWKLGGNVGFYVLLWLCALFF